MLEEIQEIMNEWHKDPDGNWADMMPVGTHCDSEISNDLEYLCTVDSNGANIYWDSSKKVCFVKA